ncbi:MAG: hypothetical protein IK065_06410, partial [Neisseriaceae bacterium]|nr:hypothetical protein [Neisseriaceae bacterium]
KSEEVVDKLKEMKLYAAAKKVEDGIEETLTFMNFSFASLRLQKLRFDCFAIIAHSTNKCKFG